MKVLHISINCIDFIYKLLENGILILLNLSHINLNM